MSQPTPVKTKKSRDVVADLAGVLRRGSPLLEDLEARAKEGVETYGTRLMTHNGRDALQDAHEEILDALVYMWQAKMEKAGEKSLSMWLESTWRDLAAIERQIRCLRMSR